MKNKLEEAMQKAGMNQTELALAMNVTPQAVNQWINGTTNPGIKRLNQLATILRTSIDCLIIENQGDQLLRKNLQDAMNEKGINAYDMEALSGVPQPTTQRFLSGKQNDPRSQTIQKWASALGKTEGELRGLLAPSTTMPDTLVINGVTYVKLGEQS